jgi:hypothetical protein
MAAVYNYDAANFKSAGPAKLRPSNRESYVYMTQDESDNLDVVVITATTYKNNIIKTRVEIDGAMPGTQILVKDDPEVTPKEDEWYWDAANNRGNFTWLLQPTYTDGVVLGHFKFVDNYCFRVEFKPNWNGAISNIVFLSGTVAAPQRVLSVPLSTNSAFFEFCQYPKAVITKTDATCSSLGSATIASLNNLPVSAYKWTKDGVTIATTSTVTGLQAGDYEATITVGDCTATRPVTIGISGVPVTATWTVSDPTKTVQGKIVLTPSGGKPPYAITWTNSAGTVFARNVTTVNVAAGTYTVSIYDGCHTQEYEIVVAGPGSCAAGTFVNDEGTCSPCPAGTYSDSVDSDSCTVCPPGSYNIVAGSTSCTTCQANTFSGGATTPCSNCPASTYSMSKSGHCTPCPIGTSRPSGSTTCTACAAGAFRCDGQSLCEDCPEGTFSSSGAGACTACDPGTYSSSGSSTCTSCAANTFAASGAKSCTACPTGTSAPAKSSVLLACM